MCSAKEEMFRGVAVGIGGTSKLLIACVASCSKL